MYCQHFGFDEKPFDVTPNPKFIFASEAHREALASLIYGIGERRGFIVLVGEVGTGKTLLLNTVLDRLDEGVKTAFIYNTAATFDQFMTLALAEFGIASPTDTLTQVDIIHRLNQFAIEQLSKNGNVVLIIDEAQNLSLEDLEKIRLLSNLETRQRKLVQIVLSGQPELEVKLATYELRQLAQRINIKRHIIPLNPSEAVDYIHHRLTIAGHRGSEVFTRQALEIILNYSGGIPRRINMLCDNALLIAFGLGKTKINESIIEEAVSDLKWIPTAVPIQQSEKIPASSSPKTSSAPFDYKRWGIPALIGLLVFALGILWGNLRFGTKEPSHSETQPFQALTEKAPPGSNAQSNGVKNAPDTGGQAGISTNASDQKGGAEKNAGALPGSASSGSQGSQSTQPGDSQEMVTAPRAVPKDLGEITVSYGENLGNLIQRVYGEFDFIRTRNVLSANPQLTNPNVLEIGDVIQFPAVPVQMELPQNSSSNYWVILSEFDTLDKSHAFVRNLLASGIGVRVISRWKEGDGLRFEVVLKEYAGDRESAMKLARTLPPEIANGVKVSQIVEPDWVYFSNPLLLPKKVQPPKPRPKSSIDHPNDTTPE